MTIRLEINADTPEELIATINGLATLGRGTAAPAPVAKTVAVEPEALEETPAQTTERRTRRTKAEMEAASRPQAAPAPVVEQSDSEAATPASNAGTDRGTRSTGEGTLAAQIREVNAADGQPTRADVEAATTAFCDPNTGKGSMKQAREILRANFLTVEGQPVDRLGPLQSKDFAAYIALLK